MERQSFNREHIDNDLGRGRGRGRGGIETRQDYRPSRMKSVDPDFAPQLFFSYSELVFSAQGERNEIHAARG